MEGFDKTDLTLFTHNNLFLERRRGTSSKPGIQSYDSLVSSHWMLGE